MSAEHWMWLAAGLGYGAVNSGDVLSAYPGGAAAVQEDLGGAKLDELLTQKQADRLAQSRPEDFALRIRHAEAMGVQTLGYDDARYPAMLRSITNPPPVLFVKGDVALLNGQLSIAMVGARRPSAYGVEVVKALGRGIAMGGAIIVSGLAAGLDAEAHKAALAVNGPTIACVAFGHDKCYPAANRKLMEVIERYGAVISEYPPGTEPEKPYFLHRNRIIAGFAHGLVVVEARRHSGTMSTVNFATDYGRDVFAVPGSVFSELSSGTNAMIREGAYLAAAAVDVLGVYGIELTGEDPVSAAAKRSADGRPAPADAGPAWQQSLDRYTERTKNETVSSPKPEELPGQQSLGEVLRKRPGQTGGRVGAAQAVEAFRTLQQSTPPTTGSEVDVRNAALDEMVAAVTDSIEITGKPKGKKPPAQKAGGAEPFPWHQVERLDRKEIEDLSAATPPAPQKAAGGRTSLGSRLFGLGHQGQKQPPPPRASNAPMGRVEAIGAVERVGPASRVSGPALVSPVALNPDIRPFAPVQAKEEPAAAPPRAQRPPPPKGDSLAGRLSTLQSAGEGGQDAARPPLRRPGAAPAPAPSLPPEPEMDEPAGDDPNALLSDNAGRALAQLGPGPVSLADICERSGLSSAEAMAALTELELAGLSRQLAGRQFIVEM